MTDPVSDSVFVVFARALLLLIFGERICHLGIREIALSSLKLTFCFHFTHRASEAATQCIVIGPVCVCVCVCLWDCYHDNSKLRASILTKLGLYR